MRSLLQGVIVGVSLGGELAVSVVAQGRERSQLATREGVRATYNANGGVTND
jgi:hypothetical protein